ncbi:MAG: 3-methyl-2-oxobutanoate hydroxymethyltransferase [Acidobacteria bacterium]|nr:3-methyl-2-oxobutanoate hydroxymethyltransferase [Acidobacteriota bacterium]
MSHLGTEATGKITTQVIQSRKQKGEKITALTAYDYPSARLVDEAGIDIILVGDSLSNVVLGHENTLSVTLDDMLVFARAVRRGTKRALVVGDMPFGSYHINEERALESAVRYIKEGGVEAVKIEGGRTRALLVERLVENEIPVMGHIGLTPQSLHKMGGYKVQGKTLNSAQNLIEDAVTLEHAGIFALVLEGIPEEIACLITERISIPTIGIGAGSHCDGQILVYSDLLGLTFGHQPKFVRKYVDLKSIINQALTKYVLDIKEGKFPADSESYHMSLEVVTKLKR